MILQTLYLRERPEEDFHAETERAAILGLRAFNIVQLLPFIRPRSNADV
jgi:hypothetical protein